MILLTTTIITTADYNKYIKPDPIDGVISIAIMVAIPLLTALVFAFLTPYKYSKKN